MADILERNLGISHAVTGFDFHFGKDRRGGPAFLMAVGRKARLRRVAGRSPSATRAPKSSRRAASVRCLAKATSPRPPACSAIASPLPRPIVRGKQLGRTLGYPTANMVLPETTQLRHGIYAVRLSRADGSLHDGVASFGRRPTVDVDGAPLLETFVFDFSGDLYGETCTVSFFGFLRGEEKFEGLDALVAQMRRDEAEARALLAGVRPLSALDARISFAG